MDPFLEGFWPDVHTSLIVYLRNALQPQLPEGLFARVEESLTIDVDGDARSHAFRADVLVANVWGDETARVEEAGGVAVMEPDLYRVVEQEVQRRVEIIDLRGGGQVVTVIEVLSRTNKSDGAEAYRTKSLLCRQAAINLVEVDLLRGGQHVLAVPWHEIPAGKPGPYVVCVARGEEGGVFRVWHIGLLQRLPAIAIPLRPADPEAVVDLQPLLEAAYRDGRYDRLIDYGKPLDPPLPPEALAHLEEWRRGAGIASE